MAATMKDIARRTGLGLATISSYFNGGNVREKNRIKIEEAIEELHYEVNEVARGLKTNATKTIGVVIPELNNTFCAEIITGMEDVLRSHGYATIVCDCRTDKKLEREAIDFLIRRRVDGIINMPVDEEGNHLKKFQKTGKPIVLIDRKIQGISCDSVLVDNKKAAEDAVRQFIERGHRNIGSSVDRRGFLLHRNVWPDITEHWKGRNSGQRIPDLSWRLYDSGRCTESGGTGAEKSGYDSGVCDQLRNDNGGHDRSK